MLRYLRASKWKLDTAIHRIEDTLKWRREFGLYTTVTASHVEPEAVTGKEIQFGFDVHGRPALYLIPSRQNTTESARQIEFTVFILERCIDLMGPGVECATDLLLFTLLTSLLQGPRPSYQFRGQGKTTVICYFPCCFEHTPKSLSRETWFRFAVLECF